MAEVRPLDLGHAADAAAAALGSEGAGTWMRRVSVVVARRVDGVDVETEYLWQMDRCGDGYVRRTGTIYCDLPPGHAGNHEAASVGSWARG